jgi:hypothetical protein
MTGAQGRLFLSRLFTLLAVAILGFALTSWVLVRVNMSPGPEAGDKGEPDAVVRSQLAAIARGDAHSAYALFSQQYRAKVSFLDFQRLILEHASLFHGRAVQLDAQERSMARAVLNVFIESRDGEHYTGRYTLLSEEGRWWIDDMYWRQEDERGRSLARLFRDRALMARGRRRESGLCSRLEPAI